MATRSARILHIIRNKGAHYKEFQVKKKSGGFRQLVAPSEELKSIQRELLDNILKYIPVDSAVHGFVEGKSIVTNAAVHTNKICIVNIDLKDFFPSIKKNVITHELSKYVRTPYAIAELVTYKDSLPQGSPCSPCISNIVCKKLDGGLRRLAKKFNADYTRYADDITFSSKKNNELDKIIPIAHSHIKKAFDKDLGGLQINWDKIQVMRKGGRQVVTGLTVNKKVSVPRPQRRKFRAELHKVQPTGFKDDLYEEQRLKGYASFIMSTDKKKGIKFKEQIDKIFHKVG